MILWLLPWWWPSKGREMTQIGRVMFCTEIGPIYQIGQQGYVSIWFEKSGKVKKGCVSNEQLPNWPAKQAVIAVCQWHSYLGHYYISIQGNRALLLKGCCFISMKGGTALCRAQLKTQGLYKGERFSTDISVSVANIKKFQKTKWLYFLILLLGGPSPPSQLVPNPFNWSPRPQQPQRLQRFQL